MPERNSILVLTGLCLLAGPISAIADEVLRDPTRPYLANETRSVAAEPRFMVNAIFVSASRRIAIVNGQRVGVGGRVGRARVTAIAKDGLTLEIDGKRITARMTRGSARQ